MKALTLWQPWASLIADKRKPIETRPRAWQYVGDVAIHAGLYVDAAACRQFGYDPLTIPTGVVVAIAYKSRCVKFTPLNLQDIKSDEYGDFTPGRFGYFLENIRKLHTPVKARGYQSAWDWPTAPCVACKEQMPEGGSACPHCDWELQPQTGQDIVKHAFDTLTPERQSHIMAGIGVEPCN